MSESLSSPFFTELLGYLQRDVEKRAAANEFTLENDLQKKLAEALKPASADAPVPLTEIIENYQYLFKDASPIHIERKLLEAFSPKEFALKIYRGLPRIYHRDNPAQNHVKKDFSHLGVLKRLAAERFILPLYEKRPIPKGSKICLFTWVIADGWGDLIAAKEALSILKEKFPDSDFKWLAFVPKRFSYQNEQAMIVHYEKDCSPSLLPKEALETLRSSDLILSLPTYYPETPQLMDLLKSFPSETPFPRLACIGEYGYIESSWFHPKSGHCSMGLHFLEKGIMIRKPILPDFSRVENQQLLQFLFGTVNPGALEIEKYLDSSHFYLAYLCSPVGGAVYLQSLLIANDKDEKPIDICTPDIGWFVAHVERMKNAGRPVLEWNCGVAEISVHYEGKLYVLKLAETGKKVRILSPGPISDHDFRLLVRLSEEFVGVRGNQSFSEAVSAGRAFFYDGAVHSRYFIKDLLALAENRLGQNRRALAIFRGMGKAYLHNLPLEEPEKAEWVDETHFQEREPWPEIAAWIGKALKDPDALAGFKKFNQILAEEYSFNSTLCHLVRRELAHRADETLAQFEEKQGSLFAAQSCTIGQYVSSIASYLEKK